MVKIDRSGKKLIKFSIIIKTRRLTIYDPRENKFMKLEKRHRKMSCIMTNYVAF